MSEAGNVFNEYERASRMGKKEGLHMIVLDDILKE